MIAETGLGDPEQAFRLLDPRTLYEPPSREELEKEIRLRMSRFDPNDLELMEKFEKVRLEILCQKRDPDKLREEVRTMREKMRSQLLDPKDDRFDLKQSAGGMVDIEFIVQYLALLHASEHPEIVRRSDNVRILNALNSTGVIDDQTAHILRDGYLTYRAMAHKLSREHSPFLDEIM